MKMLRFLTELPVLRVTRAMPSSCFRPVAKSVALFRAVAFPHRSILNPTNHAPITNKRRRSVVADFEHDVDLFAGLVGNDKAGLGGVRVGDRDAGFGRVGFLILPPSVRQCVAIGIGRSFGVQYHTISHANFQVLFTSQLDHRRMVGVVIRLDAPISSRREIILDRANPAPLWFEVGGQFGVIGDFSFRTQAAPCRTAIPTTFRIFVVRLDHGIEPRVLADFHKPTTPTAPVR